MLRGKTIFEDPIRLAKPLLNIAQQPLFVGIGIFRRPTDLGQSLILRQAFVQFRRAFGDRRQRIEHRRQRLVFDFDQLRRLLGEITLRSSYHGNFFSDEAHAIIGQHRHVAQPPAG
jgi:hypothetical protein